LKFRFIAIPLDPVITRWSSSGAALEPDMNCKPVLEQLYGYKTEDKSAVPG